MFTLTPIPACTCNPKPACSFKVMKTVRENVSADLVIKFVKGLNDYFESVRPRILVTTPLPDIKTAFNMAITHEIQQTCGTNISQVMLALGTNNKNALMQLASLPQITTINFQNNGGGGKKFGNQKMMFYCTYCNNVGILWEEVTRNLVLHQTIGLKAGMEKIQQWYECFCKQFWTHGFQ